MYFRSHTVMNSTSSNVFLSTEEVCDQKTIVNETGASSVVPFSTFTLPSYMNVDLGNDASVIPLKIEQQSDSNQETTRAYMNISPMLDKLEMDKPRLSVLPILSMQYEQSDEDVRHSYANLSTNEIETLKKRHSVVSDRLPCQVQTPPPYASGYREVRYAILNLDKKNDKDTALIPDTTKSTQATPTSNKMPMVNVNHSSTPNLSSKAKQNGYVTIDFDKTQALLHSVNSNNNKSSDIIFDEEGSRKTRHNSTISELMAS